MNVASLLRQYQGQTDQDGVWGGWHTAFGKGRRTPLAFVETLGLRRTPLPALWPSFNLRPSFSLRRTLAFFFGLCLGLLYRPSSNPLPLRRTFARPPGLRRTSSGRTSDHADLAILASLIKLILLKTTKHYTKSGLQASKPLSPQGPSLESPLPPMPPPAPERERPRGFGASSGLWHYAVRSGFRDLTARDPCVDSTSRAYLGTHLTTHQIPTVSESPSGTHWTHLPSSLAQGLSRICRSRMGGQLATQHLKGGHTRGT